MVGGSTRAGCVLVLSCIQLKAREDQTPSQLQVPLADAGAIPRENTSHPPGDVHTPPAAMLCVGFFIFSLFISPPEDPNAFAGGEDGGWEGTKGTVHGLGLLSPRPLRKEPQFWADLAVPAPEGG